MLKNILLALVLISTCPATAHEAPKLEIDFIHQSHELIEGDESGNFLSRWKDAFNFKARVVDGYRWSQSVGDEKYRNLAIDSLFLFGLSHGTEMLSGPLLLGIGYAQSWPDWVMGSIAGGGTLISIPGLDPLCMVAFAFYAKNSSFREGIGYLRLGAISVSRKFAARAGINDYVAKIFTKRDVREYLETLPNIKSVTEGEFGSLDFTYQLAESAMEIVVHYENGESWLESVAMNKDLLAKMEPRDIRAFTRQFGWNAAEFIKTARRTDALSKPYVQISSEGVYRLAPRAIAVKSKLSCGERLSVSN